MEGFPRLAPSSLPARDTHSEVSEVPVVGPAGMERAPGLIPSLPAGNTHSEVSEVPVVGPGQHGEVPGTDPLGDSPSLPARGYSQ